MPIKKINKNELNPKLWEEDGTLKKEVSDKIQEIVSKFIDAISEDGIDLKLKDILVLGSNANYTYTKDSDIDVHIIADTTGVEDPLNLLPVLYNAYKRIFNNKYNITIYGHEIEMYVESNDTDSRANGIYSIFNGWIKTPKKETIKDIDEDEFNDLFDDLYNEYEILLEDYEDLDPEDVVKEIDSFIDKLHEVRQESLLKEGEYGVGNFVFKEFRNRGIIKKLKDMKTELTNTALSLESFKYNNTGIVLSEDIEHAETDDIDIDTDIDLIAYNREPDFGSGDWWLSVDFVDTNTGEVITEEFNCDTDIGSRHDYENLKVDDVVVEFKDVGTYPFPMSDDDIQIAKHYLEKVIVEYLNEFFWSSIRQVCRNLDSFTLHVALYESTIPENNRSRNLLNDIDNGEVWMYDNVSYGDIYEVGHRIFNEGFDMNSRNFIDLDSLYDDVYYVSGVSKEEFKTNFDDYIDCFDAEINSILPYIDFVKYAHWWFSYIDFFRGSCIAWAE